MSPRQRTKAEEERFELAQKLIGRVVRFNHMQPGSGRRCRIVNLNGMVQVEGFAGEFAPHLFQIDEEEKAAE